MRAPQWEPKVNWNTWLQILQIAVFIGGGFWFAADLRGMVERNTEDMARIENDVNNLKSEVRTYADYGFRITNLENGFVTMSRSQRESDQAVAEIRSDIAVMKEILQRLDKSITGSDRAELMPQQR